MGTNRLITAALDIAEVSGLDLVAYRGREAIGELFQFDLTVTTPEPLDIDSLISSEASLTFFRDGEPIRRLDGCIARCVDLLNSEADRYSYELRLMPLMWLSQLVSQIDIYMDMTIGDLLGFKLGMIDMVEGTDFDLRLNETYEAREFMVQYEESDLAFLLRWIEHLGISLFFEEREHGTAAVFSDGNHGFGHVGEGGEVPFYPRGERNGVFELRATTDVVPAHYIQRDYNYMQPQNDVLADVLVQAPGHIGASYEFGSHVATVDEAARMATIRSQEHASRRQVLEGRSLLPELRAGAFTRIAGHPRGDRDVLITSVEHGSAVREDGQLTGSYENRFTAIAGQLVFRPERRTPKPRVSGFVTGRIESSDAESAYADVDDDGRYTVRFLFDTAPEGERQASLPVRMMQPHSGPGYGMHFPLRNGVEVLVCFVGGDPDRPIIVGTAPNPQTASPVTAGNKERNVIRTGGGNEIDIDDTEGSERIKMSTPHLSTTFQLGAPNAPEDGATLTTMGAKTDVATVGLTQAGGFSTAFSTTVDLLSSSNVVSVAGKPSLIELLTAGSNIAGGIITLIQASKTEQRNKIILEEKELTEAAYDASTAAHDAEVACDKCRAELDGVTLPADVQTALDGYNAAQDQAKLDYLALIGVMEDRNGIILANREGTNPNFMVQMQQDVEDAMITYDYSMYASHYEREFYEPDGELNSEDALVGLVGTRRPFQENPNTDSMADVAAAASDLSSSLTTNRAALEAITFEVTDNSTDPPTVTTVNAYDHLTECLTTCGSELEDAREAAIEANQKTAEAMLDHSEELRTLREEEIKLENANNYNSMGGVALSILTAILGGLSMISARSSIKGKWKHADTHAVKEARPYRRAGDINDVRTEIDKWKIPIKRPQYTHILGSENSMGVFGDRDLTMWAPDVLLMGVDMTEASKREHKLRTASDVIFGLGGPSGTPNPDKGRVTIVGNEVARLLSPHHVEIAGKEDVTISSGKVRIFAKTREDFAGATSNTKTASPDTTVARIHMDSDDDGGEAWMAAFKAGEANARAYLECEAVADGGKAGLTTYDVAADQTLSRLMLVDQKATLTAQSSDNYEDAQVLLATRASDDSKKSWLRLKEDGPTARLQAGKVRLVLEGKSDDAANAKAWLGVGTGANHCEIAIKNAEVHVGTAGSGELHIDNAGDTTLKGTKNLQLTAADGNVTIAGTLLDIGDLKIDQANISIAAGPSLNAVLTTLSQEVAQAKSDSKSAQDAADAAQKELDETIEEVADAFGLLIFGEEDDEMFTLF